MAQNVSEEEIREALTQVKHPAINCSLVDLGIVQRIEIGNDNVVVTLAFPFPNIPIADYLINSVKARIDMLGFTSEVRTTLMNPEEVQRFLAMEKEHWKGGL